MGYIEVFAAVAVAMGSDNVGFHLVDLLVAVVAVAAVVVADTAAGPVVYGDAGSMAEDEPGIETVHLKNCLHRMHQTAVVHETVAVVVVGDVLFLSGIDVVVAVAAAADS